MIAAKEKTFSPSSESTFAWSPRGTYVQAAATSKHHQPSTTRSAEQVVSRFTLEKFRACKSKKSPIGSKVKSRPKSPWPNRRSPEKTLGETRLQLRQTHWAIDMSQYRAYFVPGKMDPSGTVCVAKTCDKDPKMKNWPKCPDKFIDNQKDAIAELISKGNKHDGDGDGKPDRPANDQLTDKVTQAGQKTKADKVCPNSPGQHVNVYHKNKPVAPNDPKNLKKKLINTIWYCKCCDDSSGTATARNEWKVSGKHNRDL